MEGTGRTNVQAGLVGMRAGTARKVTSYELAVANKGQQVLVFQLGRCVIVFLLTCEQGRGVAVWSSLGMRKEGEVLGLGFGVMSGG